MNLSQSAVSILLGLAAVVILAGNIISASSTPNAEPGLPTTPILRIETGRHVTDLADLDIDQDGRFMVTGSLDKTVRVWSLPGKGLLGLFKGNLRLARTLRVPIGKGQHEGEIYAVAISGNGEIVAAGGHSADPGVAFSHSIYIFERDSGKLLGRICQQLQSGILQLAFSPDGRFLAATLGRSAMTNRGYGLRIFYSADGKSDWKLIAEDTAYGDESHSAHFYQNADAEFLQLATTSFDGKIRLYDIRSLHNGKAAKRIKPVKKIDAPGGGKPFRARFAPDGLRIAVGYVDTPAINILAPPDLALMTGPDSAGLGQGNLQAVDWSPDGNFLYAGGTHRAIRGHRILKWDARTPSPAAKPSLQWIEDDLQSSVRAIRALPAQNALVFGALNGTVGMLQGLAADPASKAPTLAPKEKQVLAPVVADFSNIGPDLQISADGKVVRFTLHGRSHKPKRRWFSLKDRKLYAKPPPGVELFPPKASPLPWRSYISWRRANGQEIKIPAPGGVWGINVARSGKVVAAALGDGTLRWYNQENGQELLALLVPKEGRRWVMWTPEGFFDAADGGEALIGYHLNRGVEKAPRFVAAAQLNDLLYRPDVVRQALVFDDQQEGLAEKPSPPPPSQEEKKQTIKAATEDIQSISTFNEKTRIELDVAKLDLRQHFLHRTVETDDTEPSAQSGDQMTCQLRAGFCEYLKANPKMFQSRFRQEDPTEDICQNFCEVWEKNPDKFKADLREQWQIEESDICAELNGNEEKIINIMPLPNTGGEFWLPLKITAPDGYASNRVIFRINGVRVKASEEKKADRTKLYKLKLQPGHNYIQAALYSEKDRKDSTYTFLLRVDEEETNVTRKLYGIAVGVENYNDQELENLDFPKENAGLIADILKLEQPKVHEIEAAFDQISQTAHAIDTFVLYLSGYAKVDQNGSFQFIVSADDSVELADNSTESLTPAMLELEPLLAKIPARKSLVILDIYEAEILSTEGDESSAEKIKIALDLIPQDTGRDVFYFISPARLERREMFSYELYKHLKALKKAESKQPAYIGDEIDDAFIDQVRNEVIGIMEDKINEGDREQITKPTYKPNRCVQEYLKAK